MKIFLISQSVNNDYDTYDSAVVIAEDEEEAKRIHPADVRGFVSEKQAKYDSWCALKDVEVEYIGEAKEDAKKSIVCASFNAG